MTSIASIVPRERVTVTGRVSVMRVRTAAHSSAIIECTLDDGTGTIEAVFLGYRSLHGLHLGEKLTVEGVPVMWEYRMVLLNPRYTIVPA
jgi:DNA/RNA endonuclease YhcR with UshA esterase domain